MWNGFRNKVTNCWVGKNISIKSKINLKLPISGQRAVPASYPWLAAIGYNITNSTTSLIRFLCGGTLITQRHVMSAGHCIIPQLTLARLGAYDISLQPDNVNTIDAFVIAQYVHELYDAKSIANDISILKLDRILAVTNTIRPACLPISDSLRFKDFVGE
jgi:secreted trypsin-like serine protease